MVLRVQMVIGKKKLYTKLSVGLMEGFVAKFVINLEICYYVGVVYLFLKSSSLLELLIDTHKGNSAVPRLKKI